MSDLYRRPLVRKWYSKVYRGRNGQVLLLEVADINYEGDPVEGGRLRKPVG